MGERYIEDAVALITQYRRAMLAEQYEQAVDLADCARATVNVALGEGQILFTYRLLSYSYEMVAKFGNALTWECLIEGAFENCYGPEHPFIVAIYPCLSLANKLQSQRHPLSDARKQAHRQTWPPSHMSMRAIDM